jgi:hypothetical protein
MVNDCPMSNRACLCGDLWKGTRYRCDDSRWVGMICLSKKSSIRIKIQAETYLYLYSKTHFCMAVYNTSEYTRRCLCSEHKFSRDRRLSLEDLGPPSSESPGVSRSLGIACSPLG